MFEVWHLDEADYEMILSGADEGSLRDKLQRSEHRGLFDDARGKIATGVTSVTEVMHLGLDLPWAGS